jgi:hypothetical protein
MPVIVKPSAPVINANSPLARQLVFSTALIERGGSAVADQFTKFKGSFAGSTLPTWTQEAFGPAIDFTGSTTTLLDFSNAAIPQGMTKFSVAFSTYYINSGGAAFGIVFIKYNGATNTYFYLESNNGATLEFVARRSTTHGRWDVPNPPTNAWSHFVLTYDGSSNANNPVIYMNGAPVTVTVTAVPVGTWPADGPNFNIGGWNQGANNWGGRIGYFHIWNNRLLTAQEVRQLYANPFQMYRFPSLRYALLSGVEWLQPISQPTSHYANQIVSV